MENSLPAIALSRKGQVRPEDLEVIHQRLHGNNIAIKYLGSFCVTPIHFSAQAKDFANHRKTCPLLK